LKGSKILKELAILKKQRSSSKNDKVPSLHLVERNVTSWDDFIRLVSVKPLRDWAFRGQSEAGWQLWPKISRELRNRRVAPRYWKEQEHRLIWIFQRKAIHFLDKVPDVGDTPQWMALMQHHGAPTRLLDFTWSPYVAAFFALESSVSDAAVWAINAPQIGTFAYGPHFKIVQRPPSPEQALSEVGIKELDAVAIGEPYFKNRRVIAQSGTFAFPFDIKRPIDEVLSKTEGVIEKLVLRGPELRKKGLGELYRMNITYATLFPDLDGLARSLAFELEHHYAFDPTTATP
jgi:FRG domain